MRPSKRRAASRDDDHPATLEDELDQLALQIVRKANRCDADGVPIEPLQLQLQALKIAGSYFALRRKHVAPEEDEGSGWGNLLMNGAALVSSDDDDDGDELDG